MLHHGHFYRSVKWNIHFQNSPLLFLLDLYDSLPVSYTHLSLSVLRARVNTQLRKQASNHKNAPIHIDLFHFDFEAMTFYVGDSKVELSKTEQKLLRLLVENRGRTMTRGDLVDRIWTDGAEYVDENALSVTIKRLRDKPVSYTHLC